MAKIRTEKIHKCLSVCPNQAEFSIKKLAISKG